MITKDMTIGEVIKMKENAPEILMGFGMGCVGCPSAQAGDQRRQIRAARFENPPPRAPPCPSGPCRRTGFR